jgi:Uncharacterized protein conserved in bacteria
MAQHLDLEEQEQIEQLKHFWNTWGTLITAVLVLVFGALAAWNGYQYWQNRQATQAAALFDALDTAASAGDMPKNGAGFRRSARFLRQHGADRTGGLAARQSAGGQRPARRRQRHAGLGGKPRR